MLWLDVVKKPGPLPGSSDKVNGDYLEEESKDFREQRGNLAFNFNRIIVIDLIS